MSNTPPEPADAPEYVLGTDDVELERLGLQHRLWADSAHTLWRRAALGPGARVLDVGCGPGYASIDIAQLVGPTGCVLGVDESPGFVAEANRRFEVLSLGHAVAHEGDVQRLPEIVPEDAGPFDAAYLRWVLCFVPEPEAVIAGIASRLRPGGRIIIQDYFNYRSMTLAPRDERFTVVIDAVERSWRERGGNPDVVAELPAMLHAGGASDGFDLEHLDVRQRIARKGTAMLHWPDTFFASVIPRLVAGGYLTEEQAEDVDGLWASVRDDETRFMLPPPVFEVIAVRR